jgi:toxin-antitoxin system PIN domain toxin
VLLPDVNVLTYAHREDGHPEHPFYASWLTALATGPEPFALSVLALVGLVRVVTNPRIFKRPSTLEEAIGFASELVGRPTARIVGPGPQHWELVTELCRTARATAKLVADAQHAAVAIEHGCTLVTTDGDFARFPRLRWHHPLAPSGQARRGRPPSGGPGGSSTE